MSELLPRGTSGPPGRPGGGWPARPSRAWLAALAVLAAACPESHPARDGGGDASPDADGGADAELDGDADLHADADLEADLDDGGEVPDPACPPGHDPGSPMLKLHALSPLLPLALSAGERTVGRVVAEYFAKCTILLAFDSLDDGAAASLAAGTGASDDDVTYHFSNEPGAPVPGGVRIDGRHFESDPVDVRLREVVPPLVDPVALHLHQAVFAGDFTTSERCSVGREDADGWELGGTLVAAIPVSEARVTSVGLVGASYTYCQVLSGLFDFVSPTTTCDDVDPSAWPYQPDTTVPDGAGGTEPAWILDADFAATAVQMARDAP